ncbi:acyl-CoA thioesterase [Ornithinibacillus contaminans]|uniref:acyl-CoA thioesterase n=1 Tax=Ornithinibacillus contaminans TaxID=694055 RepID=UPI0009F83F21|nr:thioesterase family protein [Ornithinibacillus contaminans]
MKKVQTEIEVRYQETDQMGVVYHANYLVWFEIGRTKFIEQLGLSYMELEQNNVVSPVIDAQLSFKRPAKYGEKITIYTWLDQYDGLRTVYGYEIIGDNGEIKVTGKTKHVIVNKETFRPLSLRKAFPAWHEVYMSCLEGEQ